MILIIELASVLLGLMLIVGFAVLPGAVARQRQNDNWNWENSWRP